MSGPVIVGHDGGSTADDALALGRRLATMLGTGLLVTCAYHASEAEARDPPPPWVVILREQAEEQLAAATRQLDDAEAVAIAATSPARGLTHLAESRHAAMIVVGSSHRGAPGRALLGTVGTSLLHGAPCPVAVAPRGCADADPELRRVAVGFDGSPEARHALRLALQLAEAAQVAIRLVTVMHPGELFPTGAGTGLGYEGHVEARRQELQEELDRAVAGIPAQREPSGSVIVGDPDLALRAEVGDADLLVVGSRGYGPIRRVLLGSVAASLLRDSPCPVLVAPRGAEE